MSIQLLWSTQKGLVVRVLVEAATEKLYITKQATLTMDKYSLVNIDTRLR